MKFRNVYFDIMVRLPLLVLISGTLASAQHANVFISQANQPNEPALAIDPKNPLRMAAGSNQNNVYLSADGGLTWSEDVMTSPYNVRGDPCVVVDTTGAFYFFHLSDSVAGSGYWLDRIVCQRLNSGSTAWTPGVGLGFNPNPPRPNHDKEWAAVDPNTNAIYATWTQFDRYGSTAPTDSSNILFSKSLDRGETWSTALRINQIAGGAEDEDRTVEGAVPSVGPNGEIYVAWAGPAGLRFDRSLDGGTTWLANDVLVDSMPGGWDFDVPGIFRANGFPVTAVDRTSGPNRGTIYINWSDQSVDSTDTDIWLKKSNDGGMTWSSKKRVNNDPPGRHQFFTWMALDQSTGHLWFAFYDRREQTDSATDVYMACSKDGGETFVNFRVSLSSFQTEPDIWTGFLGDYLNISAAGGVVRPIWIRRDGAQRSVWTALVDTGRINENASSIRYVIAPPVKTPARRVISIPGFTYSSYFDILGRWHRPSPALESQKNRERAQKNSGRSPPIADGETISESFLFWPIILILLMGSAGFLIFHFRRRI